MLNFFFQVRNAIIHFLYTKIAKPIFFLMDPEFVHDQMTNFGILLGSNPATRLLCRMSFGYSNKRLEQIILGIHFKNPIGLAAGFDKDAKLTRILPSTGFGFEEVGSITGEPCAGNPKKRLWRIPKRKSLRVYYGLKNEGSEKIAKRLANKQFRFPVGISIAKTNSKDTVKTQAAIDDYVKAYKAFLNIGDYYTINISCPNVHGGLPFTDPKKLEKLLKEIRKTLNDKPIFIKLPPTPSDKELNEIIKISRKYKLSGFISSNLSKKHPEEKTGKGGLSGKIVESASNELIRRIYKKTKDEFVIIGVGGVFTAEDAYKKIRLGASLIQLITGMIYEGPQQISEINRGLAQLLKRDGFKNISEAIGADNK